MRLQSFFYDVSFPVVIETSVNALVSSVDRNGYSVLYDDVFSLHISSCHGFNCFIELTIQFDSRPIQLSYIF